MYRIIEKKKSPPALYTERCKEAGVFSDAQEQETRRNFRASLKEALQRARSPEARSAAKPGAPAHSGNTEEKVPGPSQEMLGTLVKKLTTVPPGFPVHPKLKRIVEEKASRLEKDGTVDWAFGESLAFGSLLLEGVPLRLSGQDSARGTFSQRHLIWWDAESLLPQPYTPLANLAPEQVQFSVYDSPLSEYSVLGFEYGFSLGRPRALVLWEAQFGDFSNGGQVIIDNYVAAGEAKWGTANGIVLLLPHGYEGQGPEHSSAHLERYLMLCARDNIQVCNCTTPAQYFHLLRRQAKRSFRTPLIVMTPKSLLRHPSAVSPIGELSDALFHEVLDDPHKPQKPGRLLLCTGKIFYELAAAREKRTDRSTAIVRIEQLYPFPEKSLAELLKTYRDVTDALWVQEEPRNRGAWLFMKDRFERAFPRVSLSYVGREESASPATGSHARHEREQRQVVTAALAGEAGAVQGK
jgi:2-oxoglutarate dehydrogenase E1 component